MAIENYCFCELVPLYVLDLLTDSKRVWVERELQQSPELAEELTYYQTAATAIPYGVPIVPIATDLKDRLFARLQLAPPPQPENESEIKKSLTIRTQDFQWQPYSVPGIEIATLHTDNIKREVVGVLRAAPGVSYPLHSHATGEEIYILEGDLVVEGEVYGAFDYIRSEPSSTHAPYTTGGCMFFFRTSMDDEYVA
ncbi:anti-ECFsigma factor, ChrR [Calothrix sp. NIES-4071]|nr:anti-ECFsigma factor, ChrR [Calothrix sp. NIES-4071]BAZ61945.1 anti-ECFsigma factor, ChrR [Calothrix sp. NIES-4105]